jgi:hypothetical protein
METLTSSTPMTPVSFECGGTSLNLSEINAGDAILIWTQNSFYRFLVTDAATKRGQLLRGGQPVSDQDLTLIGTEDASSNKPREQQQELKTGASVVFYVLQGTLRPRLVTSPITQLNLVKSVECQTNEFNRATWGDQAEFSSLPLHQEQLHPALQVTTRSIQTENHEVIPVRRLS